MDRRVLAAITLMEGRLARPFTVTEIAHSVCLSPTQLHRLFRRETGAGITQYAKRLRMAEACRLLQTTFLPVKQVAIQVGAGDISHFVRDFEKINGLSPSRYRGSREQVFKD